MAVLQLPILLDLESPVKLQMGVVVVVNELGDSLVFTSSNHARGRSVGLDCIAC